MNWRLSAAELGLRLTGAKRRLTSTERTRADIQRRVLRPESFAPPRRLARRADIAVHRVAGMPVYRLAPSSTAPHSGGGPEGGPARRIVVYLHGGGYTAEISPFHWRLVARIAERTGAEVRVPIYPLAPLAGAATTVPATAEVLDAWDEDAGADGLVVMGDSAGAGLSLAAAQYRLARGRPAPRRLILISPWLDATVADPRTSAIEPVDAMLGRAGLSESARLYSGDLDTSDPLVSPLFGDLAGLGPVDVFTGTADLLNPDAHRLAERCAEAGVVCRIHEAEAMPHGYPMVPLLREGAAARAEIFALIRS